MKSKQLLSGPMKAWADDVLADVALEKAYVFALLDAETLSLPRHIVEALRGDEGENCRTLYQNLATPTAIVLNAPDAAAEQQLRDATAASPCRLKRRCAFNRCVLLRRTHFEHDDPVALLRRPAIQRLLALPNRAKLIVLSGRAFALLSPAQLKALALAPQTDLLIYLPTHYGAVLPQDYPLLTFLEKHLRRVPERTPVEALQTLRKFLQKKIEKNNPSKNIAATKETAAALKEIAAASKKNTFHFSPFTFPLYLHAFTLREADDYHGLLYATASHSRMEKFLRACWADDPLLGRSNNTALASFAPDSLFFAASAPPASRADETARRVRRAILHKQVRTAHAALRFALAEGCLPRIAAAVVRDLDAEGRLAHTRGFTPRPSLSAPDFQLRLKPRRPASRARKKE